MRSSPRWVIRTVGTASCATRGDGGGEELDVGNGVLAGPREGRPPGLAHLR
jgi:hypothetical protein